MVIDQGTGGLWGGCRLYSDGALHTAQFQQLSWMKQALAGCQEFSIASNPGRVIDTELIKTFAQNEESKTW